MERYMREALAALGWTERDITKEDQKAERPSIQVRAHHHHYVTELGKCVSCGATEKG